MTETGLSVPMEETVKPGRRWLVWLTVISIAVLVLAAGGWMTVSALLNKSPKEMYLLAEWRAWSSAQSAASGAAQDEELRDALAGRAHDFVAELSADVDAQLRDEYEMEEVQMVRDVLNELTLRLSGKRSASDRWGDYTVQLTQHKTPVLDLNVAIDPETIALSSEELFDDTYYVNRGDLDDWIAELRDIEAQLEKQEQAAELLELSEEQWESLRSRYGGFLYEHLQEEFFTLEEGVNISTSDGTIRGKKITLELDSEELQQLVAAFIDEIRADSELQQLLVDRLYTLMTISPETEYLLEEIDREYLAEMVEDGLYEAKQAVLQQRSLGRLKISAYLTAGNEIVERNIVYEANLGGTEIDLEVETARWKSKDGKITNETKVVLELEDRYNDRGVIEFESSTESTRKDDAIQRDSVFELSIRDNDETILLAELELQATEAALNNTADRYVFTLKLDGSDEFQEVQPEIHGDIRIERDQDLSKDYAYRQFDYKLEITGLNAYGERETITLELGMEYDVKFDDRLRPEELSDAAVNVTDMSDEEMDEWLEQIGEALYERLSSIGG